MFNPNNNNRKGTGFTNINRVLSANQGNKLGNVVVGGVQNQAENVKVQANQAQDKFKEEAEKNRLDSEENIQKRDNVIGRFNESAPDLSNFKVSSGVEDQYNARKTDLQNRQADIQNQQIDKGVRYNYSEDGNKRYRRTSRNAIVDLLNKEQDAKYNQKLMAQQDKVAEYTDELQNAESEYQKAVKAERDAFMAQQGYNPSEEELAEFAKFRSGVYSGPKGLQDFQTLKNQANEVEQLGNLTRSTGGTQELLRRFVGGEGYNQGQQRLDNLILGKSGDLGEVRKTTRDLEKTITDKNNVASEMAQEYQNRAKMFADDTVSKLTDSRNTYSSDVDEKLKEMQAQEEARKGIFDKALSTVGGRDFESKQLSQQDRLNSFLKTAQEHGNADEVSRLKQLITRSQKLNLNPNNIIQSALVDNKGQNINRGGAANIFQETQLNSLDRLLGKQGTDIEFAQPGAADYEAGNMGLNFNAFNNMKLSEQDKFNSDAKAAEWFKNSGNYGALTRQLMERNRNDLSPAEKAKFERLAERERNRKKMRKL